MNSLVEVLKLYIICMLNWYRKYYRKKTFRNYSPRFFTEKRLKGDDYFVLFKTSSRCGGLVLFVSSGFRDIPVDITTFPNSIEFKCFWKSPGGGLWKEVLLKPQFLGELSNAVDVEGVELELEGRLFAWT